MTNASDQTPGQPPQSYLPPIPTPPPPPPPGYLPPGGVPPGYPPPPPPGRSMAWSEVFKTALTQPNVDAYQDILNDPQVSTRRAYVWIVAAYTVAWAIQFAGRLMWGGSSFGNNSVNIPSGFEIICLPFVGVLGLIFFLIVVSIQQFAARLLGGQGRFDHLVYVNAAWSAPLSVLSAAISLVPGISCFGGLLSLYGLVLSVISIKTVHRFESGRAILVVFWWIPLLCLCVVAFVCLIGPAVGNVFQNILTDVATSQP